MSTIGRRALVLSPLVSLWDAARAQTANPRYEASNAHLMALRAKIDAVFIGDSITDGWGSHQAFFEANHYVERGIAGETTGAMLLRFKADVLDLRPRAVHILGGINDLRNRSDPALLKQAQRNVTSMVEQAQAHHIAPVVAAILPYAGVGRRGELTRAFNAWARQFAEQRGAVFVDYGPLLGDEQVGLRPQFTMDGLHLSSAGYAQIETVARDAITRALAHPRGSGRAS